MRPLALLLLLAGCSGGSFSAAEAVTDAAPDVGAELQRDTAPPPDAVAGTDAPGDLPEAAPPVDASDGGAEGGCIGDGAPNACRTVGNSCAPAYTAPGNECSDIAGPNYQCQSDLGYPWCPCGQKASDAYHVTYWDDGGLETGLPYAATQTNYCCLPPTCVPLPP